MNNCRKKNKLNLYKIAFSTITIFRKTKDDDLQSFQQWFISGLVSLLLAAFIAFSSNTVNIMNQIVNILNNVSVAFIAMIVGSFSLYQALLGGKVLHELYQYEDLLKDLNESWLGTIMLYLFHIILNIILLILFQIIPNEYLFCGNYLLSCLLALLFIFIYLTYSLRIFIEIRNLIVNLYNVFQIYNKIKILNEMEKEDTED